MTKTTKKWMIYGANGYSGKLIAQKAKELNLIPILAGRSSDIIHRLAKDLGFEARVFNLDSPKDIEAQLIDVDLVIHCAGPFSKTAKPMIEACLKSKTHYLDITGEISVFELAKSYHDQAQQAGIVICPGVGFDVIPTDCLASLLKQLMPDATHLCLGFDSKSGFSPGTAKTSVEGLAQGGKIRKDGKIMSVPLAYKTRKINFGNGEKLAMTIPWGDVSTAHFTTNIPNIEVYIPASPKLVGRLKRMNFIRPLLGLGFIQNFLKKRIDKSVKGPSKEQRDKLKTYLWGEVTNSKGETQELKLITTNGYTLTIDGSLLMVQKTLDTDKSGYFTPSTLVSNKLLDLL
jgi:short subunit dehydrogenase-like uncharacterized protein